MAGRHAFYVSKWESVLSCYQWQLVAGLIRPLALSSYVLLQPMSSIFGHCKLLWLMVGRSAKGSMLCGSSLDGRSLDVITSNAFNKVTHDFLAVDHI